MAEGHVPETPEELPPEKRRIGVFVCHCGGNISDYVDVAEVAEKAAAERGVVVSRTQMFSCSDAGQAEMIEEIRSKGLDALVVASCSPKLHMLTFRTTSERAGLNPYEYVQVNLREQCSWAHTDDRDGATEKGTSLVRAGIAKAAHTHPLEALRVETAPRVLVVGAGVTGLRAALALADLGLEVHVAEQAPEAGGAVRRWGAMAPGEETGVDIVGGLLSRIRAHPGVFLHIGTELVAKQGSIGDFHLTLQDREGAATPLHVGAILVATGFDSYRPKPGEFGYGMEGVVTLPEFHDGADLEGPSLTFRGRPIGSLAFIYCVGSRQLESELHPEPNTWCSRYCCNATTHLAGRLIRQEQRGGVPLHQFHLYRDMRTYGSGEVLYEQARRGGALFLRYGDDAPPTVEQDAGGLLVRVRDELTAEEEIEIPVDLVVLVTGMVPRANPRLMEVLKLPLSKDGFLAEIHPKLRPVETMIDGVFIAGTAQGPKTMAESVASALAAVSKAGVLLKKGFVDLEPLIARVDTERCIWCEECLKACPYGAVERIMCDGKEIAHILASQCKGEGACVPVCPYGAIDIEGYTDAQITAMIDACAPARVGS
ncbi:MAG: CoB--CoM heterodisulfide reductase iron-sulfur subunit A family protein [Acidimicrobiia bacterium]|nr:CoB--CoM heterodisulfide reductase iron-sulfur subunit A family protein [Acidimicrobiia bacterium]